MKKIYKSKKVLTFILFQNIVLFLVVSLFFYYKFYEPLSNDIYLFPEKNKSNNGYLFDDITDPAQFNDDYIINAGYYRDESGNRTTENRGYGLDYVEVIDLISNDSKVYFIDVREVEEYDAGHIDGAIHYRVMDITIDGIKSKLNINENEFNKSLVILVCHDGGRGLLKAKEIDKVNVKYLIGGIESLDGINNDFIKLTGPVFADYKIFDKKYQKKYQTTATDAINIIEENSNVVVIDGRHITFYDKEHIKDSIHLKIGHMTTDEYNNSLNHILSKKGAKIVIFPDRYSELFYANLLLLRLEKDYGFNDNDFYIVFNQFDNIRASGKIKLESSF